MRTLPKFKSLTKLNPLIQKYFPDLNAYQQQQLEMLQPLYADWNAKINLISRKDFDHFYERHVLHSLSIAKFYPFGKDEVVLDVGTGGGFPGVPLAILFPHTKFILCDSISKKIKVVDDICSHLHLNNCQTINQRAENLELKADYVISRATAPLSDLVSWTKHLFYSCKKPLFVKKSGWIVLKGGNLEEELKPFYNRVEIIDLQTFFSEPFFETKKLVYLPF